MGGVSKTIGGMFGGGEDSSPDFGDANAAMQERIDFNQEQLDEWEDMFGDLSENVLEYYENLDPTKYATEQKQALKQNMSKQLTQYNENMASKGLLTSGMRAQTEKEAAFTMATGNAAIDQNAEAYVTGQQQNYLNTMEHRRTNAISGVSAAYGDQAQMLSNQAITTAQYNQQNQSAGLSNLGGVAGLVGKGVMGYASGGWSGAGNAVFSSGQ